MVVVARLQPDRITDRGDKNSSRIRVILEIMKRLGITHLQRAVVFKRSAVIHGYIVAEDIKPGAGINSQRAKRYVR